MNPKPDTKIYMDFIKVLSIQLNVLKVGKDYFELKTSRYSLFKDSQGWHVMSSDGQQSDEIYKTKSSAIYWTIKNKYPAVGQYLSIINN